MVLINLAYLNSLRHIINMKQLAADAGFAQPTLHRRFITGSPELTQLEALAFENALKKYGLIVKVPNSFLLSSPKDNTSKP